MTMMDVRGYRLLLFLLLAGGMDALAQEQGPLQGTVSYVTPQSVYVKFSSTGAISVGDTLFTGSGDAARAALVVEGKSSLSCLCRALEGYTPAKDAVLTWRRRVSAEAPEPPPVVTVPAPPVPQDNPPVVVPEDADGVAAPAAGRGQRIGGRISAASYSTLSGGDPNHRMRYSLNLRGDHIGNSRFSAETYVTFRHTFGDWAEVQENVFDVLKILSLSVRYDVTDQTTLMLGRRINPRISSMGAIDGIHAEQAFGRFQVGLTAGSRPNFQDYRIDPNLLQAGAYLGYATKGDKATQQSTLAFIEQRNGGAIDRRFLYFQHNANYGRAIGLFLSSEADLYSKVQDTVTNTLRLTNLYVSLRYRFSSRLNASLSYDNRRNVIFFESYKNYIDQLIDEETRQGLRLNLSYRPWRLLTLGAMASVRFQASGANSARNLNAFATVSRLPWLGGSATWSYNYLETAFLSGHIYGFRYLRDIVRGKVSADAYYRWVDYHYPGFDTDTHQDIAGLNLSFRITRMLALHVYGETTIVPDGDDIRRVNLKLIQRI